MAFGIISGIIIARVLFAEGKGVIAAYSAPFDLVMSATAFGVPTASAYFFSKKEWDIKIIAVLHSIMLVLGGTVTAFAVLGMMFFQGLADNFIILTALFINVFVVKFISFANSIAMAKKWIKKIIVQEIVQSISSFIMTMGFIWLLRKSIEWYFIILVLSEVIGTIVVFYWLKDIKEYRFSFKFKKLKEYLKPFFSKSIMFALPLFVFGLNYKADIIILNHFVDKKQIGIYSVGVTLSMMIWLIPDIFKRVVISHSVATKKENENKFSRNLWKNTLKIMFLSMFLILFLYFLSPYFLPLLYGKEFINSVTPFKILLIGTFMMTGFKMLNGDLSARGKPEIALYIFSLMALLNIVGNLIFIPTYGIIAAAWTSTATYFLGSGVFMIVYYFICVREKIGNKED